MATAQYATVQGGGRDAALLCPLCPNKVKGFADTTALLQHMKGKHGLDAGTRGPVALASPLAVVCLYCHASL